MLAKSISGAAAAASPAYIEDVFSTYLYTGTSSAQTINNGIDLAGNGGLVWNKGRNLVENSQLFDTTRGLNKRLSTEAVDAQDTFTNVVNAFNANGFTAGNYFNTYNVVAWTFRKQSKFFDIVTYTGTGAARTISHNLGSVPGCIIVKRTDTTGAWQVYHRSLANTEYLVLNSTAAKATGTTRWNSTTPTSTEFSLGTDTTVNANGGTYVAYLFAHNAGGFGLTGTDNVISCGSYTGASSNPNQIGNLVNVGFEPQWVLIKATETDPTYGNMPWILCDNMRGMVVGGSSGKDSFLLANSSNAEDNTDVVIEPDPVGFRPQGGFFTNGQNRNYIYIAIRRGPMKVPTSGTSVFSPFSYTGDGTTRVLSSSSPLIQDMWIAKRKSEIVNNMLGTRLTGINTLFTNLTNAEDNYGAIWDYQGVKLAPNFWTNASGISYVNYAFRRAPGFFDVVAYTGTGSARTVSHNLGVAPELMIVKRRNTTGGWAVYSQTIGNTKYLNLQTTDAAAVYSGYWNNTSPTSSAFTVATDSDVNASGSTYVAYLFATVTGVSKVGSYTGTGTTKQIDCGFTGGARFVLIKRTDSTGDWYVWDTARGIVSGNDPYLLLNSDAAEVTNTDYIDTYSAGFEISSTAPAAINANGGTFIFLAVA